MRRLPAEKLIMSCCGIFRTAPTPAASMASITPSSTPGPSSKSQSLAGRATEKCVPGASTTATSWRCERHRLIFSSAGGRGGFRGSDGHVQRALPLGIVEQLNRYGARISDSLVRDHAAGIVILLDSD